MKSKFSLLLTVLLIMLCSFCDAASKDLIKIADTSNGSIYVDTSSVAPVAKNNKMYMLVSMEEHYTNSKYLTKLRNSDPKLKKVNMRVFLYMFNNNGTQYCMPGRFMVDVDGNICLDMGADLVMKPVNKSVILVKTYETAYTVLERKQKMLKKIKNSK